MRPSFRSLTLAVTTLVAALFLSSCGDTYVGPETVTDEFWHAIAKKDKGAALKNAFVSDKASIDLDALPAVKSQTNGRIVIESDQAQVTSTLSLGSGDSVREMKVETYLERHKGDWKVDYDKTIAQIQTRAEIEEIVEKVKIIGETLSTELNRGIDALKDKLPALQQDLKRELDRIENDIHDQLPELRERLEEFTRQLEEALTPPEESEDHGADDDMLRTALP